MHRLPSRAPTPVRVVFLFVLSASVAFAGETRRISYDFEGGETDGNSWLPVLSANGRILVFSSFATDVVEGDENGSQDVFVLDRRRGGTTRISVDSAGREGDADTGHSEASVSANGRFVAFSSAATNLVEGDGNGAQDAFLHDRRRGTTIRVSVNASGGDGDDYSVLPSLSANGRFVAFQSRASNLIEGDDNETVDVFVHDRRRGTTTRVSVDSAGREANGGSYIPQISGNGRFVAFLSNATNLVEGDSSSADEVFVHDRRRGTTVRVAVDPSGREAGGYSSCPRVSATGRFVAFMSSASNLVPDDTNDIEDVFVRDMRRRRTVRVSVDSQGREADSFSVLPSLSASGRFVAFQSAATNLVEGDDNESRDVFLHDRRRGSTVRISATPSGGDADGVSAGPFVSPNGRFVAFDSFATNLVAGDENGMRDVFLYDRRRRRRRPR